MTKEQLLIRLGGIEWDDLEVKTAKSELPRWIVTEKGKNFLQKAKRQKK